MLFTPSRRISDFGETLAVGNIPDSQKVVTETKAACCKPEVSILDNDICRLA
jgi:hypothetical protein